MKFMTVSQKGKSMNNERPVWEKDFLTLDEASELTGICVNKLRQISNSERCPFVLWNGSKRLLKRKKLLEFLEDSFSI